MKYFWILMFVPFLFVGCQTQSEPVYKLDLSDISFTWEYIALLALAYLANSGSQFSALANVLKKLLQTMKVLPADDSKAAIAAEELAKKLAELYLQAQGRPEFQARVLALMQEAPEAFALDEEKSNVRK